MQPSDSLASSAAAPVPLAFGLPRCGRFSTPPGAWSAYARASEKGSPDSPSLRKLSRKARASQVPGPSSSCVPWSKTPPGAHRSSPISHGATAVAFRQNYTLGTRKEIVFEATTHGPHARVPTLRRPRHRDRRKARYRPGRAHPWPGGFRTRWTTNEVSWRHRILHSPSTSLAWSHRFAYPRSSSSPSATTVRM